MLLAQLAAFDTQAISEAFLSLHAQSGFTRLSPSSLLHDSVPMSFVMSAGLIQVENNLETIIEETGGKFTFTQPCFRHFDLQQVGLDPTRLSLFHMAAAFNIGSSERETVLPRLWYFLTEVLNLAQEHLWISYLDDAELGRDQASFDCWQGLGVKPSHLIPLDQQHCFWRQRSTGQIASDGKKCGPHTEVFYERIEVACPQCEQRRAPIGTCRCGRFVEIANSLFIENYLNEFGQLIPAPTVFAECVVGLERLEMILRHLPTVYHIQRFAAWRNQFSALLPPHNTEAEQALGLILDHLSAFISLVEHGAPAPGRGGRKYIMRKLARELMKKMLLLDWNINEQLNALASSSTHGQAIRYLQEEWQRFSKLSKPLAYKQACII
ncbi:MAG: alanine--tRNA ligase-related protein [Thiolinea sp.]